MRIDWPSIPWPDDEGPFELSLTWETFDGRLAPAGVKLRLAHQLPEGVEILVGGVPVRHAPRRPLEASDLEIPLRKVAERLRATEEWLASVALTAPMADEERQRIEAQVATWRASAGRRRGPLPTQDEEVTRVYLEAAATGHPSPIEAVAAQVFGGTRHISDLPSTNGQYHTAAKAIQRARARGCPIPLERKGES
ncbi:MAG TPA: hypothetical protein VIK06_06600 [Candidatus Limnocylindrales bacterium]